MKKNTTRGSACQTSAISLLRLLNNRPIPSAAVLAFSLGALHCAGFSLVVERMGDGASKLTNSATPVFLQSFQTDGTLLSTISLPIGSQRPVSPPFHLMDSGSSSSDGQLTRSVNGLLIQIPGYNATNAEPNITSSPTNTVLRTVGVFNTAGVLDTSRAFPIQNTNNFRSVVSVDGSGFWTAGQSGLDYVSGNHVTPLVALNFRTVNIFNGQLFCTMGGSTPGIYTIGTGLPTSTPALPYIFLIMPGASPSPYAFQMNSSMTTCFVADDGTNAGIVKFSYTSGSWVSNYTLRTGAAVGARGLAVDWSAPGAPVLYATTAENSQNRLIRIVDTGAGSTATNLATAPNRTVFRGVDFLGLPAVWRYATSGNWSAGGGTPWYNWSVCPVNDIHLQFQNVNSWAAPLNVSTTNNTSLSRISSLSFTSSGYGGSFGTSYTLRGNGISLSGGLTNDTLLAQSIKLPLALTAAQTFQSGPGDIVLDGVLSGSSALNKTGSGALTMTAVNLYSGALTVYEGVLKVNGTLTNSLLNFLNGTLSGNGTISGPVIIQNGATFSPGNGSNSIGTLTVRGQLTLLGSAVMDLSKAGTNRSCDSVGGISTLNCGGVLNVGLLSGTLAAGDTFTLFRATQFTGAFALVNLPPVGPGLYWDTTALATTGTIEVGAIRPATFSGITRALDAAVQLSFSGPPGLTYQVWSSSDLAFPPIQTTWTWLGNGIFSPDGAASFYDFSAPFYPQRFYVISVP